MEIKLIVKEFIYVLLCKNLSPENILFLLLLESINMVSKICKCPNVETIVSFLGLTQHIMVDFSFLYPSGFHSLIFCLDILHLCSWKKLSSNFSLSCCHYVIFPLKVILISYNETDMGGYSQFFYSLEEFV